MAVGVLVSLWIATSQAEDAPRCYGQFVNPITDICWSCLFPISLGNVPLISGHLPDTPNPTSPVCACGEPVPRIGLSIGFWEPIRLVDVTTKPFCFVGLGGMQLSINGFWGGGAQAPHDGERAESYYDVHWYVYPLLAWLNVLTDAACMTGGEFDIAYLTELDPLWHDDELAFILNPEAALFADPIAQTACAADCMKASTGLPTNALFWCAGCQGTMYPLNGWLQAQVGGVQASVLALERMTYKLHREALLLSTAGHGAQAPCQPHLQPILHKAEYRYQMTYPVATTGHDGCQPFGRTTARWGSGHEYPVKGEDFSYIVWHKRNCCLG